MLDDYIDQLRKGSRSLDSGFSPFSRLGSIFNVVVCGSIVVGALYFAFTESPFGFAVAAVGVAMEVVFVRVARRAHRGDFDRLDLG